MPSTPPPLPQTPRRLSPLKWFAGVLTLVLVMISCGTLPFYLRGGAPAAVAPNPAASVIMTFLGAVMFVAGAALYGLTLLTGCFTLSFERPFFKAFGIKLWVLNLVVGLLLQMGCAFMLMPLLYPMLLRVLPGQAALLSSLFAPFVAAQLVLIWINLWGPLDPIVVTRRLRARGVPPGQLAAGRVVGLSNPDRSSLRKFGLVEEDYGMLWIGDDRLVYWGDVDAWEVPHDRFIAVERKADAGSVSSYFGAVHVILRFLGPDGAERRVRVHSEGDWTQTGKARALNDIADRLTAWQEMPRAGWVTGQAAFPVNAS
jgi:hypothetical protein